MTCGASLHRAPEAWILALNPSIPFFGHSRSESWEVRDLGHHEALQTCQRRKGGHCFHTILLPGPALPALFLIAGLKARHKEIEFAWLSGLDFSSSPVTACLDMTVWMLYSLLFLAVTKAT